MRRGHLLLTLQGLALLAVFGWPGRRLFTIPGPLAVLALVLVGVGLVLMLAGAWALGRDLTVFAKPRRHAALHTEGVYAISRNPIYAGLVLASLGHVIGRGRPEPIVAWIVLVVVLQLKMGVEERYLSERFGPEYTQYARRVPRLIGVPRRP